MALVPGSNAGPYRIVGPLGRGGMATVYKAYEANLDRHVALKVLPREFLHDPNFAQRFRQEAQVIALLEHPNIIPIYAYGIDEAEGIPWMAMRLIPSGSLSDLLKRERLARARAVAILRGVADALDYAHGKGIVHRDVKPQNVLLDQAARVYLADFGIAKILESSGGLTASGMITGTPQYMAPEQATGLKIGPPADVYALGIMAYEMFTGRVPFSADTPVAVLMKHVNEPLPLPGPDVVPEPLLRALLKAASKKPEERWPTAGAFVDALAAGLGAPTAATLQGGAPTLTVLRTLALDEAPATAVSPATAPAPPRTAPAPGRPPALRPAAGQGSAAPAARRGPGIGLVLLGIGALGLVAAFGLVAAWLLLGRSQLSSPAEAPPATVAAGRAPAAPGPTAPAPRDPGAITARATAPSAAPTASVPTPRRVPAPTQAPALPSPTPAAAAPTPAPTPVAPAVDPEVQRLAASLGDRDAAVRRQAAQELASRGAAAAPATGALGAALADRSPDVRLRAAEALGRIGPAALPAVPALVQALRDSDVLVAGEAAKTLGLVGDAAGGAAAALGAALGHPAVGVRREAARALAKLGPQAEPALGALVTALSDKDKTVCAQAARALGHIGAPARSAVPRLTALGKDPDLLVSREAQGALEAIGRAAP